MQRWFLLCLLFASLILAQPTPNSDLLVKFNSSTRDIPQQLSTRSGVVFELQPLITTELARSSNANQWYIAKPVSRTDRNPWDLAYEFAAANPQVVFVEPDYMPLSMPEPEQANRFRDACAEDGYDADWDYPTPRVFVWHLDDAWSQLRSARQPDTTGAKVRIAHLDTGYDPSHISAPKYLMTSLQKNFVDGENANSAIDPGVDGLLNFPGHGTATLALLAGNRVVRTQENYNDYVGGAPFSEIVPIRLSSSVVLFQSSSFGKALYYISSPEVHCDVLSMSMGGVPSQFWADAVNDAYEAGVTLVTAAGNNFGDKPMRELVYPARFNRVIAVCGVTYKNTPYYKFGFWSLEMQGNWGPAEAMTSAIASYTPNVPWASRGCGDKFDYSGAGTSAATPQVAAAAAQWLQKYRSYSYDYAWQRVNAVRRALFTSAEKGYADSTQYYGNGVLKAKRALDIAPYKDSQKIPADNVRFPILTMLFGWRAEESNPQQAMMELEMLRLRCNNPTLQQIFQTIEQTKIIYPEQKQQIREAILNMPECSETLAEIVRNTLQ